MKLMKFTKLDAIWFKLSDEEKKELIGDAGYIIKEPKKRELFPNRRKK